MKGNLLLIVFSLLCITSVSNAVNIIYVDVDGPNEPGGGTVDDPFRKIQDAIGTAIDSDIIEVRPGIYTGEGNYDLNPSGKSITIRSINPEDPNITANTVIDPNGAGRGFYFVSGEDPNCIVSGFTIRNGYAVDGSGGGIYCDGSSPSIINCTITSCTADFYGGGIYCYNSSNLRLTGCTITDNSAGDGGGIECELSSPQLTNCIINNNQAIVHGGGVDCYNLGNPILTNCTIAKTSADVGGAVCLRGSDMSIKNSILWANEAVIGEQLALLYLDSTSYGSSALVSYCNVQNGQTRVSVDPDCALIWDAGNIDVDPNFASFNPDGDHNLWDFHLKSTAGHWTGNIENWEKDQITSCCIDAGDPNSDWASEPWPNGKRINMGAYGGTNQASKNGNPADFDVNGVVNFVDFAKFSLKWFAEEYCIEDLTDNGEVDFADLIVFVENWLWQSQ